MADARQPDLNDIRDLLTSVVRGDRSAVRALTQCCVDDVCRTANDHGLLPLVADAVLADTSTGGLADTCRRGAIAAIARQLVFDEETRRCVEALERAGVPALLIKGAHLSAGVYPRADLRPRSDTDLLVAPETRGAAARVLMDLGYAPAGQIAGEFVSSQAAYAIARGELRHAVDLHWRLANVQAVANLLTVDELTREAQALPTLGDAARGPSEVHALLLACIHRLAHHYDSDRRIWLYDIHLLAGRLTMRDWARFCELSSSRGVAAECRLSLMRAVEAFHTVIPDCVWDHPAFDARKAANLAALHARPYGRRARLVVADLRALSSWHDRWRLLQEHAFPGADYMRRVYAPASGAPLAVLYAQRALRGARKWIWSAE